MKRRFQDFRRVRRPRGPRGESESPREGWVRGGRPQGRARDVDRDRVRRAGRRASRLSTEAPGSALPISKQLVELMAVNLAWRANQERAAASSSSFRSTRPRPTPRPAKRRRWEPPHSGRSSSPTTRPTASSCKNSFQSGESEYSSVESGTRALEEIEAAESSARPYGLAIVDMQMPGMTGLDLARRLRRGDRYLALKFLMLTSLCRSMAPSEAAAPWVDDVLVNLSDRRSSVPRSRVSWVTRAGR